MGQSPSPPDKPQNPPVVIPVIHKPNADCVPTDTESKEPYWHKAVKPDILPVWLGGVAAILASLAAGKTLRNLKKQTEAGLIAATAAKESADSIKSAERSWVLEEIVFSSFLPQIDHVPEDFQMVAGIELTNHGRTIATVTDAKLRFHTVQVDPGIPETPSYDGHEIYLGIGEYGKILAPGQHYLLGKQFEDGIALTAEQVHHIYDGSVLLYYYGRVDYTDVFNDRHFTQFCYLYDVPKRTEGMIPEGFRSLGPSQYNKAT